MSEELHHILELNQNCITFEPVSKTVSVFYDENNRQIFVVQKRGLDGVVVKGPDDKSNCYFKLDDRGDVLSMKFSHSCDILALQRSCNVVEFINFVNGQPGSQYSQCCKNKNGKVIGFVWTFSHEIIFITDSGVEFYQVIPERRTLKCLKSFNLSIDWFVYQPNSSLLLVASGSHNHVLQPFQFRPGTVYKLIKFEIDWITKSKNQTSLLERDVALANLYGKTCFLVLRHYPMIKDDCAHIVIYTLQKDGPFQKTNILLLNLTGRFAINIADDLIIVHHQTSQTSLIFDIQFNTNETLNSTPVHKSIFPPNSIKPFDKSECQLYSTNWVIFQPNIIIDAQLGCLWMLQINLSSVCKSFHSRPQLIDFLMMRRNSKNIILDVCKNAIISNESNQLGNLSLIFNKLNQAFKETKTNDANSNIYYMKNRSTVDQCDMFSSVFSIFTEKQKNLDDNFIVAILFEYILSLNTYQIPVQYSYYEFLITHLVRTKRFYQLQQFLQYHVFTDSKPLACLLLSLQQYYSHAIQLALDMLRRLSNANEEIIEVLLSQYKVARALRFVSMNNNIDNISARKFLEVAMNSSDEKLFYSVFKFFELRNLRLRGLPEFVKGEHCEVFVEHFEKLFGSKSALVGIQKN